MSSRRSALKTLQTSPTGSNLTNGGGLSSSIKRCNNRNSSLKLRKILSSPGQSPSSSITKKKYVQQRFKVSPKNVKLAVDESKDYGNSTRNVATNTDEKAREEKGIQTDKFKSVKMEENSLGEKFSIERLVESLTCPEEPTQLEYWRAMLSAKQNHLSQTLRENLSLEQEIADLQEYVRVKNQELSECRERIEIWRSVLDEYND
uniref:Geminin n=1 Tax=Romanomermis culicivorax TaxID=13658 RepID=A0A915KAV2_ROMCU